MIILSVVAAASDHNLPSDESFIGMSNQLAPVGDLLALASANTNGHLLKSAAELLAQATAKHMTLYMLRRLALGSKSATAWLGVQQMGCWISVFTPCVLRPLSTQLGEWLSVSTGN